MQDGRAALNKGAPSGRAPYVYVTMLFFMWGAITSVNDVLIPAVRSIFSLTDAEGFLTQFAFFLAYGIVSIPAALVVARLRPARSVVLALLVMLVGCAIIPLATALRAYPLILLSLFVIASGITLLQVAANPLSAALGSPEGSHARLVLSQAFNSLGTVVGPYLAAHTLLSGGLFAGGAVTEDKIGESLGRIDIAYAVIGLIVLALAFFLWTVRSRIDSAVTYSDTPDASVLEAFRSPWALAGAMAIFLYVGAEVSIGSVLVNFLEQPNILAATAVHAGSLVSLYWAGAMVGRFIGSAVLARVPAPRVLAGVAFLAACLSLFVSVSGGNTAAIAALSIGLFNSVMFPVIFTVTTERSTAPVSATSGLLCMAIVGGAIIPVVTGTVADASGIATALIVPVICYGIIAAFGLYARTHSATT
jgi:MFS transporter, FHS family, L-fucose permease